MKRLAIVALAAMLALGVAGASSAQGWFNVQDTKPNTIKVGAFWPSDGDVRDATDSLWFGFGYERIINEMADTGAVITGEASWLVQSDLNIVPLTLNWKNYGVGGGARSWYWGAGIGAYIVSADSGVAYNDVTRLGYNAFVGVPINNMLDFELKYHYIKVSGDNAGGLFATVGYKF